MVKTVSNTAMKYEDWLRGCVHHDGRKGNVYLPCDTVLKIADWIEAHRDVAPVRHGRWIYEGNELVCSRCGGSVSFSRNNDGLALSGKAWTLGIYCQTCGAKMDEGGADGTDDC